MVGLVCLAMTFIIQRLGNLIQAALTIFGIIGGPLLGVYTLGMFTETANGAGAISGLVISLGTFLWIGFGQPKPKAPELIVSISGCNMTNSGNFTIDSPTFKDEEYIYPFRISHLWYSALSFIVCFVIGLCVSWFTKWSLKMPDVKLNANLFTPFVANRVRKQREKAENKLCHELNICENVQTSL